MHSETEEGLTKYEAHLSKYVGAGIDGEKLEDMHSEAEGDPTKYEAHSSKYIGAGIDGEKLEDMHSEAEEGPTKYEAPQFSNYIGAHIDGEKLEDMHSEAEEGPTKYEAHFSKHIGTDIDGEKLEDMDSEGPQPEARTVMVPSSRPGTPLESAGPPVRPTAIAGYPIAGCGPGRILRGLAAQVGCKILCFPIPVGSLGGSW